MSLNGMNRRRKNRREIVAAAVLIGMCFMPMMVNFAMGIGVGLWTFWLPTFVSGWAGIWLYLRISPYHGKSGSRPSRRQP